MNFLKKHPVTDTYITVWLHIVEEGERDSVTVRGDEDVKEKEDTR